MTKAILEICRKTSAGTIVLGLGILSSCGIPSAGCGDGVVCIDDGATTGEAAKASDIKVGKYAYSPNGELIEGKLNPALESASTKLRDFGTTVLTLVQEALAPTSSGYRISPKATDGEMRMVPTPGQTRSPGQLVLSSYTTDCGTSGSVSSRILDCKDEYSDAATWVGATQGLYAETTWTLVTRDTTAGAAIWKDTATGYLWTTTIDTEKSFCQAAGVDQDDYSLNCTSNNVAKLSYCSEKSGFSYPAGVANKLGNLSVSSGKVMWRLPTRADYLRAELNGIRYVLDMDIGNNYWTANVWSSDDSSVWTFSRDGQFTGINVNDTATDVICVGVEETQE
jgi:hypothetical protein